MSIFKFIANGQTFSVKAPDGVNEEQARALFKQQADTGSLAGLKVGSSLSAATQAAGGLAAAAQISQQAASLSGALPSGTNLNSITSSIGALGQTAGTQVARSLQGSAAGFNSLTTGASGATAAISRTLGSKESGVLSGALTGASSAAGSIASQTVNTLTRLTANTPTNGINVADFAKQGPALSKIGSLSQADVTGALAQTAKSVGQSAGAVSNALGVGKFGLNANQLERAGMVKPGTAAAFLAQGQNDLVSVLKSPTVWTGKDGVKGLNNLLSNPGLQDKVQQGLMKTGVADLKSLGLPTNKLTPQALAGVATNAAKSVPDTVAWAKNAPSLAPDTKTGFGVAAIGAAFAVALAKKKVDAPVLQETKPEPATNTVNTGTVTAAAQRVVGDDKVPEVAAGGTSGQAKSKITALVTFADSVNASLKALIKPIEDLESRPKILSSEWKGLNDEYQAVVAYYNSRGEGLNKEAQAAVKALQGSDREYWLNRYETARTILDALVDIAKRLKARIQNLSNKIMDDNPV